MDRVVAPTVVQLRVLLSPASIATGWAAKALIVAGMPAPPAPGAPPVDQGVPPVGLVALLPPVASVVPPVAPAPPALPLEPPVALVAPPVPVVFAAVPPPLQAMTNIKTPAQYRLERLWIMRLPSWMSRGV